MPHYFLITESGTMDILRPATIQIGNRIYRKNPISGQEDEEISPYIEEDEYMDTGGMHYPLGIYNRLTMLIRNFQLYPS